MVRRLALHVGLLVALVLPGLARAQAQPAETPPATYDEAIEQLDRLFAQIERLRGQLDRTQFDLAALSAALGPDAAAIDAFVREEIAFEQYPGLLRGARGTLLGRAGNALDQAVLLGTLLINAGYEARVVRGTLGPEQARTLLAQMARPRPPAPPVGDLDRIRAALLEVGRAVGVPEDQIARQFHGLLDAPPLESTDLYRAAQADTRMILDELAAAGVTLGDPTAEAALVEEARDYYWIEYRRAGSGDGWTAAHPAFKDAAAPPAAPAAVAIFAPAAVPSDLRHRFRFAVVLERSVGGAIETHAVMDPWETPTSDLVGVPLTYGNLPDNVRDAADVFDVAATVSGAKVFVPTFGAELAPGAMAFDLDGNLYAYAGSAVCPGCFELVPAATGALTDLGGAVGDIPSCLGPCPATPESSPATALTALWIEYTLVAPGGAETTRRRTVVDRMGAENRLAGRVALADGDDPRAVNAALLTHHAFLLAVGEYGPAYVLDQGLDRFLKHRRALELLIAGWYGPGAPASHDDALAALAEIGPSWADHLLLYGVFDAGTSATPGIVAYRSAPSLVVLRAGVAPGEANCAPWVETKSVDVVTNTRRAVETTGEKAAPAAAHLVWGGVWETHAEGLALPTVPGEERFSTMVALERAAASGIPTRVVTSEAGLGQLQLSAEAVLRAREDLERGYVLLIPTSMSAGDPAMTGWWRVHPRTGETLGITSDGRGAALVLSDETSTVLEIAASLSTAVIIFGACALAKSHSEKESDVRADIVFCAGTTAVTSGLVLQFLGPAGSGIRVVAFVMELVGGAVAAIADRFY